MNDEFGSGAGSGDGSGGSGGPKWPKGKLQNPASLAARKNSQLTAAADVLQVLLQNSKSQLSDGFLRWRLEQQWPAIVGQMIAEQTLPAALERGTLHVWVKHPTWMQQLYFFQDAIKDKVNQHLDKNVVFRVRFTLSKRAATPLPESSR